MNDSQWGRGASNDGSKNNEQNNKNVGNNDNIPQSPRNNNQRSRRPQNNEPDLDELWQDLNKKLNDFFGGFNKKGKFPKGNFSKTKDFSNAILIVIAGIIVTIWLATGVFIVQEGQQAVITQFGRYHSTVGAGVNWRIPYPVQNHELVYVTQLRSVDVGHDSIIQSTGIKGSAMLTKDENIVEIKFAVQYRLNDARAYLFESKSPDVAVVQAAETAVREVVGNMLMDSALAEERDQISPKVRDLMQSILDRYKVGVQIQNVNLQQGGVRPPEQVQAAFDDVLKAGQEKERAKNEAEAYANDVVPRARGAASRLKEEATAYKERISAQATGDAQRFNQLLTEYKKAPKVTRERLYIESMQEIYKNVSKIVIDSGKGNNLLYLPLDKIMQNNSSDNRNLENINQGQNNQNGQNNNFLSLLNNNSNNRSRDSR